MKSRSRNLFISIFIFLCLALSASSFAAISLPGMPARYVVDLAGIINDDVEMKLNGYLQELEQKTTAQVIVLTINSLEGRSLEDFSLETAEKWKLGQKGKDNGVLFLVALKDRKYRFEIGYGLESILPDSFMGSIGREYLDFREGNYSTGIFLAARAVINEVADDAGVSISGMPRLSTTRHRRGGILNSIFGIFFFIVLIYLFIRHPRLLLMLFLFSSMGGGRRGWGGSGGFGGGFGSFGGGGGGGFGGGGASGCR